MIRGDGFIFGRSHCTYPLEKHQAVTTRNSHCQGGETQKLAIPFNVALKRICIRRHFFIQKNVKGSAFILKDIILRHQVEASGYPQQTQKANQQSSSHCSNSLKKLYNVTVLLLVFL